MSTAPVFERADGRFVATDVGRGPWDPRALHGGAPAALLMRAFERLPAADGLCLARVTYEFMRPVPVGPLEVHAEVVRPGRRVQLLEASIVAGGIEVVRARALQIQSADAGGASTDDAPPPPGPEHGATAPGCGSRTARCSPSTRSRSVFVVGDWGGGPCTAWFRLSEPDRPRRDPIAASATRRGRRFRQRHQRNAVVGRLPVHQPRSDALRRARAGRRVDLPGVGDPDCARRHRGG